MDWISDGWEFDNKWFYDRQVTFKRTEGEIADDGLYSKSNSTDTLTVDCDLQPVSRDDVIDDSGLILDAEYKIFCDANTFIKQCHNFITYLEPEIYHAFN